MTKRTRKTNQETREQPPVLRQTMAQAEVQLRDRVEKGKALLSLPIPDKTTLAQVRAQYYTWDEYNGTLLKRLFSSTELAQEYSYWGIVVVPSGPQSLSEEIEEFHGDVLQKLRRLESIIERLPLYADSDVPSLEKDRDLISVPSHLSNSVKQTSRVTANTQAAESERTVFVVHGRNNELKETVARFLGQLDLTPIILHEQPSVGRTIIEKFDDHSHAEFAVVLLTPDDTGKLSSDESAELQPRARQNVIFEWGFLVARLGRRRVCALYAEGVELPSDVNGVIYLALNRHGAWKMLLARELKAAGVEVDLNRAI